MSDEKCEVVILVGMQGAGYRVRIIYFDTPVETCRERICNRKGHPTLARDKMEQAIATYKSRLDAPKAEECDELIVIVDIDSRQTYLLES